MYTRQKAYIFISGKFIYIVVFTYLDKRGLNILSNTIFHYIELELVLENLLEIPAYMLNMCCAIIYFLKIQKSPHHIQPTKLHWTKGALILMLHTYLTHTHLGEFYARGILVVPARRFGDLKQPRAPICSQSAAQFTKMGRKVPQLIPQNFTKSDSEKM